MYASSAPLVKMVGIGKSFEGVSVLRDVSLDLRRGEVLALVGENGAGKSTLMKILGGAYVDYEGRIEVAGQAARLHNPNAASALGIRIIYQELSLIPAMSVAENIFLGREMRGALGLISRRRMHRRARELLSWLSMDIDVSRSVDSYSIAIQQLVEIAKALSEEASVLIMDEPTSALNEHEADRLFDVVAQLKARGVSIVYITHKMEEIYRIADRIAVLRDGDFISSAAANDLPPEQLIKWMVGREVTQTFPPPRETFGREMLRVDSLRVNDPRRPGKYLVDDVSFSLRAGEIVGLAGLRGSGNSELMWSLFGALGTPDAGKVAIKGKPFRSSSVRAAQNAGMALVTNDRKSTGLVLSMDMVDNATLASLARMLIGGTILTRWNQRRQAEPVLAEMKTKGRPTQEVSTLSGGNQQKVVLAKWLLTQPAVFMLDEPTRGVDVVAKHDIYLLLDHLTRQGVAVLLTMSELPELLGMSDRILVMRNGRITAEFSHDEATPHNITEASM